MKNIQQQLAMRTTMIAASVVLIVCGPNHPTKTETSGETGDEKVPRTEQVSASHYVRNEGWTRLSGRRATARVSRRYSP